MRNVGFPEDRARVPQFLRGCVPSWRGLAWHQMGSLCPTPDVVERNDKKIEERFRYPN